MSSGYTGTAGTTYAGRQAAPSVGEILRLLAAGAPGEILLALRRGPAQSKVLTHQVKGYTARTIYRYLPRLGELGALERNDDPGGPARVVHTLDDAAGTELAALIDRFATASMRRLPGGRIDSREWTSLGLLADLWEAGVLDALSHGPTSPTELTRGLGCLSYHQLNRRASRFEASGFFCESSQSRRQRRCYALTPRVRRMMGLIASIGRWRGRHLTSGGDAGLTTEEMATALRVLLPLAAGPGRGGEEMKLRIEGSGELAEVRPRGGAPWARGPVEDWMAMLLDGELRVETADDPLVREWLSDLYEKLWADRGD